jgi:hypothetical protein
VKRVKQPCITAKYLSFAHIFLAQVVQRAAAAAAAATAATAAAAAMVIPPAALPPPAPAPAPSPSPAPSPAPAPNNQDVEESKILVCQHKGTPMEVMVILRVNLTFGCL